MIGDGNLTPKANEMADYEYKKYDIIESCDMDDLIGDVNDLVEKGWKPVGGVVIHHLEWMNERKGYKDNITWFYQTMLLDSEE